MTRQEEIVALTRERGWISVEELAARFQVTPQTIRRDLAELSGEGRMVRVHGGAVLASGVRNATYGERSIIAAREKERIGTLCASAIPDASSLFINIGTTTEAVARSLTRHSNLMVVTNNLHVANILSTHSECEVIIAGGVLRSQDGGITGAATLDFIRQFKVDIAVIGASAIDEDGTLLDFDYSEVTVAQAIIENARKVYLVADSTKLARTAPFRIASITRISTLFTDAPLPESLAEFCRRQGVDIKITAPSP